MSNWIQEIQTHLSNMTEEQRIIALFEERQEQLTKIFQGIEEGNRNEGKGNQDRERVKGAR